MTDGYGRAPRWQTLWLPLGVVALVVLAVAALLVIDRGEPTGPGAVAPATMAGPVEDAALEGEWTGGGTVQRCAGFDDDDCSGTRAIRLAIACPAAGCVVAPFDGSYGSPPLRFEDGVYRAAGPVPPDVAPRCGGSPTRSALWRLELVLADGRLTGSYAESTIQGFDCGATGVAWDVALDRG
ncbi:hypothetical protein [Blastococcus litoris]|uniref:hypothetical protein n=1 Tax=Blastococcus litoris TaxID=2171622 RepID=UPI000E304371|nr:hypothetical protein [Blastococcus litoris]